MFSFYPNSISKIVATPMVALSLGLVGCSSSSDSDSTSEESVADQAQMAVIQGNAVKGAISNGLVSAYSVSMVNGVMVRSETPIADPVRTDALGAYSLSLPQSAEGTVYVIEVGADELTRMTCDVTEGCGTRESGSAINFGDTFPLSDDFSLKGAAIIAPEGETSLAYLSPLTHMMVARAESEPTGLTRDNIGSSKSYIETTFDLPSGALDGAIADITRLDELTGFSGANLEYGVVSAAILAMVNSPDWDSIEDILEHVEDRLASGADITSVNMGGLPDLALDDVFYRANEIASDISVLHTGDEYSSDLDAIVDSTQDSYDNVATPQDDIDPVSIVSHPSDLDLDEGENGTFSVQATGGGELSYQWRLNGQNLSGQNASSLSLSSVDTGDAGSYDVIVTNSLGSVASSAATLTVTVDNDDSSNGDDSGNGGSGDDSSDDSGSDNGGSEGNGDQSGGDDQENEEPAVEFMSVSLSWDIPTAREDDSALDLFEIQGYELQYGTVSGELDQSIVIPGASVTSADIEDLSVGTTYYFAIATRDSDGYLSDYTEEQALLIEP